MAQQRSHTASKLSYLTDLELEGFPYPIAPYMGLAFQSFSPVSSQTQFESFVNRVYQSLGKSYLPIYRMADGEFAFLVGWRTPLPTNRSIRSIFSPLQQIAGDFRRKVNRRLSITMWGEAYEPGEQKLALHRMQQGVRHIAKHGILALYFTKRGDGWCEQYFAPVCEWFDSEKIDITSENYIPFYFVYALLNGPARKYLYAGRRILVVTHLTEPRKKAIEFSLLAEGAASVHFLGISPNRSLFDHIDIGVIDQRIDLALIAAGIGSVNILQQLEPLAVPCIDCGISLECLIDSKRRLERPFLADEHLINYALNAQTFRFLNWTGTKA